MSETEQKEDTLQAAAVEPQAIQEPAEEFEGIFREHHRLVFRAAYRVTGDVSDAEDVLQTVFLKLLRRESSCNLGENPKGYMHRAAVNAALDLLRSRKSSRSISLDETLLQPVDKNPSPEARRHAAELRSWLRAAVAKLNPTAAEMFSLRYFEGFTNQEIAEMMTTSQGTVAVTLHRTRSRLQEEIGHLLKRD